MTRRRPAPAAEPEFGKGMAAVREATVPQEASPAPILIVDDDDQVRRLFGVALRRAGFQTIEAVDGPSALALVESQPVSLVVLDVLMPGMSGLQVVPALRRRPATSTTPILLVTGGTGDDGVIRGLEAGADDFLLKPVRLGELVARARSHLRSQEAWTSVVASELEARARAVGTLVRMPTSTPPDEAVCAIVADLATTTKCDFVTALRISEGARLQPLVTHRPTSGTRRGGPALTRRQAAYLLERLKAGPWLDERGVPATGSDRAWGVGPVACAPIYAGEAPVGLLMAGVTGIGKEISTLRQAALLSATIDYAAILTALVGGAMADHERAEAARERLLRIIQEGAFTSVFQPIVELATGRVAGYEALTRFHDGTPPEVRFAEARAAGLALEFEMATADAALQSADCLPADAMLSFNVSPDVVLEARRLRAAVLATKHRPLVLELTEHDPIEDYDAMRRVTASLGSQVQVAVDDAGAGYASLRHILELQPAYVKIDISIVRGIEADPLRQAMVAGLGHFARQSGCVLIGEGIETQAEADALLPLGVTLGQGYLFGKAEARSASPAREGR